MQCLAGAIIFATIFSVTAGIGNLPGGPKTSRRPQKMVQNFGQPNFSWEKLRRGVFGRIFTSWVWIWSQIAKIFIPSQDIKLVDFACPRLYTQGLGLVISGTLIQVTLWVWFARGITHPNCERRPSASLRVLWSDASWDLGTACGSDSWQVTDLMHIRKFGNLLANWWCMRATYKPLKMPTGRRARNRPPRATGHP